MSQNIRLGAGGIILNQGKILLVKHGADVHGKDFLVGPGGHVENGESIPQAVVREVKEETGLTVNPVKILFVEDLKSNRSRVIKLWYLCSSIDGTLSKTQNAIQEGIVNAGWYSQHELEHEVVYPSILAKLDWNNFKKNDWETRYIEFQDPDADI